MSEVELVDSHCIDLVSNVEMMMPLARVSVEVSVCFLGACWQEKPDQDLMKQLDCCSMTVFRRD